MKELATAALACIVVAASAGPCGAAPTHPDTARYKGLLFAADIISNAVWICPTGNLRVGFLPPTGQLQDVSYPTQLAIDKSGTVYVANGQIDANGDGSVTEYPRGQTSPSLTLSSGLNSATGVAVDSHGTVYVSNKFSATVSVFPSGATHPAALIAGNLIGPDGLAVDRDDNLYIADSSAKAVYKVLRGATTPHSLHLSGLSRPIGIAIDSKHNLYVSNLDGAASNIAVYAPSASRPSRTMAIPYAPGQAGIGEPMMLSIGPADMLIASAFLSLWPVQGEWFGRSGVVVGFADGQSVPQWSGYGVDAGDAVFQPGR